MKFDIKEYIREVVGVTQIKDKVMEKQLRYSMDMCNKDLKKLQ